MIFFPRPIKQNFDYQEYYPYLIEFDKNRLDWELRIRRSKYKRQLRLIKQFHPTARSLLDVGAGPGYFCAIAAEEGWVVRGVEPSDEARKMGTAHFQISYSNLDDVPSESFDVVTCHHVLEHIEWPQEFLIQLRNKLRTGGLLVVHVPNQEPLSFLARNMLLAGGKKLQSAMYYPIHINGFTPRSLTAVVQRQRFLAIDIRNASMWSYHYDPFFLRNYFRGSNPLPASLYSVAKHTLRCAIDVVGNAFDRGDWVVGHFRATD